LAGFLDFNKFFEALESILEGFALNYSLAVAHELVKEFLFLFHEFHIFRRMKFLENFLHQILVFYYKDSSKIFFWMERVISLQESWFIVLGKSKKTKGFGGSKRGKISLI